MPAKNVPPGPGVDASGQTVVDPTKNVLDRIDIEMRRQDDLRESATRHAKEIADLRANYDERLRSAESDRIDAIRAVDVGNVQRAAEVQATGALTLATQVTTSAEALRASQAQAAALADTKLVTALEPIQKRIDDLSRAQYEAVGGRAQVVDTQAESTGSRQWFGVAIAAAALVSSMFLGVAGIAIALIVRG